LQCASEKFAEDRFRISTEIRPSKSSHRHYHIVVITQ
jgi:hypothetical protein